MPRANVKPRVTNAASFLLPYLTVEVDGGISSCTDIQFGWGCSRRGRRRGGSHMRYHSW